MREVERADKIVARLSKDPHVQQIVADARLFDSLRESPGWQRLFTMVSSKRERWMQEISRRLMGSKKFWPEPEEIAYHRGFYEGAFYVLAHPEHAEKNLERAAQVAWAMYDEDDDSQEG